MQGALLDERYLTWLYDQVGSSGTRNRAKTYWKLFRQLLGTEFIWLIPNDDNRVEDGRELRIEFCSEAGVSADPDWMELGCSVFEMLVALSRRLEFNTTSDARTWFWRLMDNLELGKDTDLVFNALVETRVAKILDDLIFRTYRSNGQGGLFPLHKSEHDQREVEIWYQLSEYLAEAESRKGG